MWFHRWKQPRNCTQKGAFLGLGGRKEDPRSVASDGTSAMEDDDVLETRVDDVNTRHTAELCTCTAALPCPRTQALTQNGERNTPYLQG